ncbi:hypothetical protein P7K49_039902 [Saguinus oedipus]|uniref:Uncharacterized protein n=1 Tax=Saguinus oedipus TaxID=9490 RepID=A0ABQ9TDX0_SAGOE|nr:hypothetical protein P7K49_039902 [Saguinus oedipus]
MARDLILYGTKEFSFTWPVSCWTSQGPSPFSACISVCSTRSSLMPQKKKPRQLGADLEQSRVCVWVGEHGREKGKVDVRSLGGGAEFLVQPHASLFLQHAMLLMTLKGLASTCNKDLQL